MTGAERIAAERQRQIEEEGWTPEHDDGHDGGSLAGAAAAYTLANEPLGASLWPWERSSWKPGTDRIRQLEKAGALIAAEIDRLLRIEG